MAHTSDRRHGARTRSACCAFLARPMSGRLGVGIVLVGEYMGWNFAVGKGGAYAALIACWFAGLLVYLRRDDRFAK